MTDLYTAKIKDINKCKVLYNSGRWHTWRGKTLDYVFANSNYFNSENNELQRVSYIAGNDKAQIFIKCFGDGTFMIETDKSNLIF